MFLLNYLKKNIKIKKINLSLLDPFESKRLGFYEMYGMIELEFNNNIKLIIYDNGDDSSDLKKEIITDKKIHRYSEITGLLEIITSKNYITKKLQISDEYQSNLTNILVDNLFMKNNCNLPTIADGEYFHKILYNILEKKLGKKNINNYQFT